MTAARKASPCGAVVASPTVRLAEDEVFGLLVGGGEPAFAQESRHGGGEHDLAPGGAVLTTGANSTHVLGRSINVGPHDIAPNPLAHEFGHILGFVDRYFRGYRDQGPDGFEVLEVVIDPEDIMSAPGLAAWGATTSSGSSARRARSVAKTSR